MNIENINTASSLLKQRDELNNEIEYLKKCKPLNISMIVQYNENSKKEINVYRYDFKMKNFILEQHIIKLVHEVQKIEAKIAKL